MKKKDAYRHLTMLMLGLQRLRSFSNESKTVVPEGDSFDGICLSEDQAADVWKYVWGEFCILPILVKGIDDYENNGTLAPQFFYNMVYIATSLEPMLYSACLIVGDADFPEEPDINWLMGFDEE